VKTRVGRYESVADGGVVSGIGVGRLEGSDDGAPREVLLDGELVGGRPEDGVVVVSVQDVDLKASRGRRWRCAVIAGRHDQTVGASSLPVERSSQGDPPRVRFECEGSLSVADEAISQSRVVPRVQIDGGDLDDLRMRNVLIRRSLIDDYL
jgi:hypothetical protein